MITDRIEAITAIVDADGCFVDIDAGASDGSTPDYRLSQLIGAAAVTNMTCNVTVSIQDKPPIGLSLVDGKFRDISDQTYDTKTINQFANARIISGRYGIKTGIETDTPLYHIIAELC